MNQPESNLHFKFMAFMYKFRDLLSPRGNILNELGIQSGFHVLDYGCGPGSYLMPLAELVGKSGKIYALDVHPLAIQMVQNMTFQKGLENVEAILSDCRTGLPDHSMDVILLYDTFHDLREPDRVLKELHRVLKPNGILSFSDHHMKESEIISNLTKGALFRLTKKANKTFSFSKEE